MSTKQPKKSKKPGKTNKPGEPAKSMYQDFSVFMGKILWEVGESFAPSSTRQEAAAAPQVEDIPPGLAGLWTAAGAALGVVQLRKIVRDADGLRQGLKTMLGLPDTSHEDEEERLALELGTALHRLSTHLRSHDSEASLQALYTTYLERLERNFRNLALELADATISADEHKQEIQGLYLQTLYGLTRLQRM